jgi:poly(hydroxyalkanoate) depolymerase family esterase
MTRIIRITRTPFLLTMASILAAGGCAPAASGAHPDPAPSARPRAASTWEWATYTGEGGSRRYRLFVPSGYDASRPVPLVVMLHGCTQDPDDFARGTRFNQHADAAGVIVAYPEQPAAQHPQKCWTWYDRNHQSATAGEPAIVHGITREVMERYAVDPARVYLGGVSAGGAMAINTAASHPGYYTAVGVHSGVPWRAAREVGAALQVMRDGPRNEAELLEQAATQLRVAHTPSIPVIVFHGAVDAVVNPRNGRFLAQQWAVAAGAKDFLRQEGTTGGLAWTRDVWGPLAELWIVEGLGHAWSGGSPEGTYTDARGPDASAEMLRFFLAHRLP